MSLNEFLIDKFELKLVIWLGGFWSPINRKNEDGYLIQTEVDGMPSPSSHLVSRLHCLHCLHFHLLISQFLFFFTLKSQWHSKEKVAAEHFLRGDSLAPSSKRTSSSASATVPKDRINISDMWFHHQEPLEAFGVDYSMIYSGVGWCLIFPPYRPCDLSHRKIGIKSRW